MKSDQAKKLKKRKLKWIKVPFWLAGILLVVGAGAYLSYRYLINPEAFAAEIKPQEITSLKDIKDKDTGKWKVEVAYPSKGDAVPPGEPTIAELHRSDKPDSGYVFIMKASMWGLPKEETIKIYDETWQLVEERTYYYKLVIPGKGQSEAKSVKIGEVEDLPLAPEDLTAEPANQAVTLQWKGGSKAKGEAVGGSKGTVEGLQVVAAAETEGSGQAAGETAGDGRLYNIYRGTKTSVSESSESSESQEVDGGGSIAVPYRDGGIGYSLITKTSISGYQYTDSGLTNGVTYYYYATEVKDNKESDPSNKASAIPREEGAIEPPANLSAKSNWYSVTLSWDQVKGADGYRIYYGKTAGEYEEPIEIRKVTTEKDQQETYDVGIDKINYGIYYYFTVTALKSTQESAKPDSVYERALIPGDLDKDKDVDPDDFQIWVSYWLEFQKSESTIAKTTLEGDFNGDGKVNPEDFAVWNTYWLAYERESSASKTKLSE